MVPRENCRKVSKNFLTLFDDFWRFLPCARIVEKCRKTLRHFLTIFDVFWCGPFPPAPFAFFPLEQCEQCLQRHVYCTDSRESGIPPYSESSCLVGPAVEPSLVDRSWGGSKILRPPWHFCFVLVFKGCPTQQRHATIAWLSLLKNIDRSDWELLPAPMDAR